MYLEYRNEAFRQDKPSLWGESRLVFMGEVVQSRRERGVETPRSQLEITNEILEQSRKAVESKVKDYNKKYAISGRNQEELDRSPQEQTLQLDWNDPDKLKKQIEALQASEFETKTGKHPFSDVGVFTDRGDQVDDLQAVLDLVNDYLGKYSAMEAAESNLASAHGIRLIERTDLAEKMARQKKEWNENPRFTETLGDVQLAVENLITRDSQFAMFWKGKDGMKSNERIRENENLFMAILESQTNNFAQGSFLLGDRFGDDVEENKKNFPFIYQRWMEHRGTAVSRAPEKEIEVAGLEAQIKVKRTEIPAAVGKRLKALKTPVLNETANVKEKVGTVAYYQAMADALGEVKQKLTVEKDRLPKKDARLVAFSAALTEIDALINLAHAAQIQQNLQDAENARGNSFTRRDLMDPRNHQLVVELALMQFKKAMETADSSNNAYGATSEGLLHPSVRHMMIYMMYREGMGHLRIDSTGKEAYDEEVSSEYQWMFMKLAQCPYFNALGRGRFLDAEQREFLLFARMANLEIIKEKALTEAVAKMEELAPRIAADTAGADTSIDDEIKKLAVVVPGIDNKTPLSRDTLAQVLARDQATLQSWVGFRGDAEAIMAETQRPDETFESYKDRMQQTTRAFMDKIKGLPTAYDDYYRTTNRADIEAFEKGAQTVSLGYNTMNFNERSQGDYLECLGINVTGFYNAYVKYLENHKEMKVDNWDDYLLKSGNVEKLIEMFQATTRESAVAGGMADFLAVLRTLHGNYPLKTSPENANAQYSAMRIYAAFKAEIKQRESLNSTEVRQNAELKSRIEGMTFADKATEYGRSVINMLIGPGQSLANRAAGAAILVLAYKLIKKGLKGEDAFGKALRLAGIGVAAELVVKHVTGAGILDRLKITGVAKAMEGTYESILLERGKNLDITSDEHSRALYEMNKVPFKDLMVWYDATRDDGQPLSPKKKLRFPLQNSVYSIIRGMGFKEENADLRARYVVKQAMKNFFGYVGAKNQKDAAFGAAALRERWVTAVEDKNYDLQKAAKTEIDIPMIEMYRKDPRSLTWQTVMAAEIDPKDLPENFLDTLAGKAQSAANVAIAKLRNSLFPAVGAEGAEFWENMDQRYVPWLKEKLGNSITTGKEKIVVTKDRLEVWYKANESTIIRFVDNHWQLVSGAVMLPLESLYALDQMAVPWAAAKIRVLREVLFNDDTVRTESGDLSIRDFVGGAMFTAGGVLDATKMDDPDTLYDDTKNPKARFFGQFTKPFIGAFNAAGGNPDRIRDGAAYYPDMAETAENGGETGAAYLITSVDADEAGVVRPEMGVEGQAAGDSRSKAWDLMKTKAKAKAIEQFKKKNPSLNDAMLEKYMDLIHITIKQTPGEPLPSRIYAFWRMPLPESWEFDLKEKGKWPDYYDAERWKDRPPFMVDPEKGVIDNLKEGFGFNRYGTRRLGGYPLILLSQWIRLSNAVVSHTADAIHAISVGAGGLFSKKFNPKSLDWMLKFSRLTEDQLQWVDEYMESAGDKDTANSKFYKDNPARIREYKLALEVSRRLNVKLWLGKVPGRKGEGFNIKEKPKQWDAEYEKQRKKMLAEGE